MSRMGAHQSPVNKNDEWLTPPPILHALGPFYTDPCAPIVRPWPTARRHYTKHDDGLSKEWRGRVWLNPPYGAPPIVAPWLARMADHNMGTALIFARTETAMFFEFVWRRATAIMFLEGRLFFHVAVETVFERRGLPPVTVPAGGRAPSNGGAPSCLIAYGHHDADRLEASGLQGKFIRL